MSSSRYPNLDMLERGGCGPTSDWVMVIPEIQLMRADLAAAIGQGKAHESYEAKLRQEIERLRAECENHVVYGDDALALKERAEAAEADARRLIEARDDLVESIAAERAKLAEAQDWRAETEKVVDLAERLVVQIERLEAALAAAKASESEQYEVRDPYGRRMEAETKAYNKAKASEVKPPKEAKWGTY